MLGLSLSGCGNTGHGVAASGGAANVAGASSSGGAGSGGVAAGGADAGGPSGGVSAGTGGAGGAPTTKYEACVAYMNAQCNRRYLECSGFDAKPDPCPEYVALCPDFLFSEGSQLDVAGVLACAETWRSYSCDSFSQGIEPDCGLPVGKRALGEPCIYSRQCASTACGKGGDAAHPACGACVPVGKQGDPCDDGSFQCPNAYECTGEGCQPSITFNLPDGSLCERYGQCYGDSLCFAAADGQMRCQPRRKAGEDCSNGAYCAQGTSCGADSHCAPVTPANLGELCYGRGCVPDAWCDNAALHPTETVCIARAAAGQPCQTLEGLTDLVGNCQTGLSCYCEGTACKPTCLTKGREGQGCGDALSFCIPGTTCLAGKCVGVESQGLAQAACGQ